MDICSLLELRKTDLLGLRLYVTQRGLLYSYVQTIISPVGLIGCLESAIRYFLVGLRDSPAFDFDLAVVADPVVVS